MKRIREYSEIAVRLDKMPHLDKDIVRTIKDAVADIAGLVISDTSAESRIQKIADILYKQMGISLADGAMDIEDYIRRMVIDEGGN